MKVPSHYDSFQVLLLQLADEGRGEALLGDSVVRAREAAGPYLVCESFPSAYFEFPLIGDPFLDVTFLYSDWKPGTRIESAAARGTEPILDWFALTCNDLEPVSFGFELDTSKPELPRAALHFQPRTYTELVEPFCAAAGEPARARLYLDLAARMPEGWPLSFFGMFRGRADSPLRVCGYLDTAEKEACAQDPAHLGRAFDQIGFSAYDESLLAGVATLMAAAPGTVDFQFDVYPDGRIGDTFAIDIQFEIEQPEKVRESFEGGAASRAMTLLEEWGIADSRWKLTPSAAFARSIPVILDDGTAGRFAFTLMPQWVKARWRDGVLQPAKLYYLGNAELLDKTGTLYLAD